MRKGLMVMTLAAAFTAGMAMTSFAGWSQKMETGITTMIPQEKWSRTTG